MKKYAKLALFFCIGALFGTVIAWGSLLGWASIYLNPNDSLWDRNPAAMNIFIMLWLVSCAVAGTAGIWMGLRRV